MHGKSKALFWFSILFLPLCLAQETAKRPVTVDDVLDLAQVSSPQISPDGKWVLYSRSDLDWKENKRKTRFWMVPAQGGDPFQFLSGEQDSSPAWSPDSTRIAFLGSREREGQGKQIYWIRANGGEASKLSDHKDGILSFKWSHDGRNIFFLANEAKSEEQKKAEKAGEDVIAVDEGPNGQARGQWNQLWVIDVGSQTERQITKDKAIIRDYEPSPDGAAIACTFRTENARNSGNLSEIAVVDVQNGTWTRLTDNKAPEGNLAWSPDGRSIGFTAAGTGDWELRNSKLWLLDVAARQIRLISGSYENGISDYVWSPDGREIIFEGQNRTNRGLFRLDPSSGKVTPIGDVRGVLGASSFSKDRSLAAGTYSDPRTFGDVCVLDTRTGQRTRLTQANPQIEKLAVASAEVITWKSKDGLEVEGILYLPENYRQGSRLPLILHVHGGPAGVFSFGFGALYSVYAGLGYASLAPNVRGSSGYSDALLRGNMYDLGGGDYQDLMSGVDALVARGIADPERLGIKGWSYGGILGGWTIAHTDRFKAASLGAMVSDWSSEYAMGFNHDVRLWYIGGTPWDNPDKYRAMSSYTHIRNVRTPTILFHGEEDTTDTIGQSMIYYAGLKDRGVPVRFLRYPREPHGFREPHHVRSRDVEEIVWMQKHVMGIDWQPPVRPEDRKEEKGKEKPAG
ncbi:MAG: S9 family peptidase, partial [Acidobacteria bacterium]|nr:S9 family peptidase [Acidobacteriota bacterium]